MIEEHPFEEKVADVLDIDAADVLIERDNAQNVILIENTDEGHARGLLAFEIAALIEAGVCPTANGWKVAEEPKKRWARIEFIGHRSHVGLVHEERWAGVERVVVDELQRDGTFKRRFYGVKAFYGEEPLTEAEARREVLPRHYQACDDFKQPSSLPGFCADCGRDLADHEKEAAKRREGNRRNDVKIAIAQGLDEGSMHALCVYWSGPGEDARVIEIDHRGRAITRDQWEALRATVPLMPWEERPGDAAPEPAEGNDAPDSDAPDSEEEPDSGDGIIPDSLRYG